MVSRSDTICEQQTWDGRILPCPFRVVYSTLTLASCFLLGQNWENTPPLTVQGTGVLSHDPVKDQGHFT